MNKIYLLGLCALFSGCVTTTGLSGGGSLDYSACNNGNADACVKIADALYDSDDIIGAEEYARKACDLKNELGCKKLAYLTRNDPSQDQINNVVKMEKDCKAGKTDVCIALANNLIYGRGVPKDPNRGFEIASDLCNKNNAKGCLVASNYYREKERANHKNISPLFIDNAKRFAKKACDLNLQEGCNVYYKLKSRN